jgi:hypothetical protein
MATLLVSAAVNIGVGLLINAIFPPPDVNQEGPRLTELGYTSAAYGKMVNIVFGTDRIAGNIIDTTDPAIEEVVSTESVSSGKGGGQTVNTTTYTYFLTCRIAWCIEGATDIIRWWGDGKVILDASGTGPIIKEGVTHTFYPGGKDQLQDPEEVTRRGSDIPAYGHLTTSKVDRMLLTDYGNRIPNFTAEIAFNSSKQTPFLQLTPEPAGFNPPGSLVGGDVTYMSFNPDRNELYGLKGGSLGTWAADASSLDFKSGIDGGSDGAVGKDGFGYSNFAGANSTPLRKHDVETGALIESLGTQGIATGDSATGPRYEVTGGAWSHLTATQPGVGVRGFVFHLAGGTARNGSVTATSSSPMVYMHTISAADGTLPDDGPGGRLGQLCAMVPDHERGVAYMIAPDAVPATEYNLIKYTPVSSVGVGGAVDTDILVETVKTWTVGVDITGTGNPKGWAVNDKNGDIMWSNSTEVVLYNPITDTDLGRLTTGASAFQGRNNYYSGAIFAWIDGDEFGDGDVYIVNTLDLSINRTFGTETIGWPTTGAPSSDLVVHEQSAVWDDRVQALFISRVDLNSDAPVGARILKIFVNRVNPLGVPLSDVVSALSTSYQRQRMAGLLPADIDVSTLTGDTVQGYSLNNQSTMKAALQPLRDRFLFDAHQSDWIIKFPKRGATPTVTIPEEDVGILKRGRRMTDEPAVREIRQDDLSLPMSLAIRYRNKNVDYQIDAERDKRHLFPNPTMHSKSERTLDIPLVDTPTPIKQLAQKTLLTMWNERISYKTIVPWTYIALDATDVFNMGVFNETHQLRMAENDMGQGWAIELTGVVEDTKSFSSTLAGSTSPGHVGTTVPSGLPSRLFPLDAPLLSLEDLTTSPISNAYMAVGAFEDGWPGSTVMKSLDDVDYSITGTANEECAMAKVRTAPGTWTIRNGDPDNRWQEVADGGTMVVTPLRRSDAWASTTELLLLAGANYVANIRASDNQVEIFAFQNATLNDDNTVTLTRLLRGRLGTEDITDLGMSVGDTCILLSDSANVHETGPIITQSLTLSELDTETFFKGVTIGTLIEDAPTISATYTGRDIKPYFPAQISAVGDGLGGLDVSWERRTRGPFAAEWLDGTGETVLNETIERYEVTLSNLGGDFITKTVDDARTVNFSLAEIELGGAPGGIAKQFWPITDFGGGTDTVAGDQEGGTINSADSPLVEGNWVNINSPTGWRYLTGANGAISGPPVDAVITPASTAYLAYLNNTSDSLREIRNRIQFVRDLGMNSVDIPLSTVRMSMWFATGREDDEGRIRLDVENAAGASLTNVTYNNIQANVGSDGVSIGDWIHVGSLYDQDDVPGNTSRPMALSMAGEGAFQLSLRLAIEKAGTTLSTGRTGYDHIELEILTPPADITVKVLMVSETGLKSPLAIRQVS